MYRVCPRCGDQRSPETVKGAQSCPACGLIYRKYLATRAGRPARAEKAEPRGDTPATGWIEQLGALPGEPSGAGLAVRALVLAGFVWLAAWAAGCSVPSAGIYESFAHLVIIPFHEFGHLLFSPLGEFMAILGGPLFQVLLPLGFLALFLFRNGDGYAAGLMLWATGFSISDLAPYMYDAHEPKLVLLTGRTGDTGAHDFIDLFGDLGVLEKARPIAYATHWAGVAVMAAGLVWSALVLWTHRRGAVPPDA